MFALPPETKKEIFSQELLKIQYEDLIKPEKIGKLMYDYNLFNLILRFAAVRARV